MPKPWFKMWSNILDKEKIHALTGEQTKAWLHIMAVALRTDEDGALPAIGSIAFQLRTSPENAQKMVEELQAIGLIEIRRSRYVVHDWKHWQGDGKSDAQRKREQRERERDVSRDGHVTVTPDVPNPVTNDVTDLSRPRGRAETRQDKTIKKPPLKSPKGETVKFVLPDWIPENDWNDYIAMRKTIRKPATERAKQLVVAKLDRLREDGNSPAAVLQQSIVSCHQGVWPLAVPFKSNGFANGKPQPKPNASAVAHAAGGPQCRPGWIDNPELDGDADIERTRAEWDRKGFPRAKP